MKLKPTQGQIDFLNWEFGIFFHFGIRSFYPGRVDWDGVEMPAEGFNPDSLDCEQWLNAVKQAGATYAVLTVKHHDGFALWQSAYSNYGVANSPWKNGKGDVVREFVDACKKYGIKVGLYYSPAQWGSHAIPFESEKEYDDYFVNQITELLSNYGKIDYLWFDGCGSEGHVYDRDRIMGTILSLQPHILTFYDPDWGATVRWVGNEDGYASLRNPLNVCEWDFSEKTEKSIALSKLYCMPTECDCKLRRTWFFDNNEDTIKPLDELFGMYEASVGHGSNLLLNVGPDNHGLICKADLARLLELGKKIKEAYSTPHSFGEIEVNGNEYSISHADFYKTKPDPTVGLTNRLVLSEDITNGQSVKSFNVYAHMPFYKHKRILIYKGETVGHKLICQFPAIRAPKFTVEVTDCDGEVTFSQINAYFVK